ncbi:hypothetical protein U8326_09060 [Tsuneonella sp. CC-YZS046]|uniref:DUF7065 domain-containing protein n=1 Tax=Tsuneonella sp. CC-YZS046 TaxID=3042152 RepID=UPI002D79E6BC|nr:hypothetical protein [Tsuneonella sp. CC-YZS046]WRO65226.1 hypothetical protein U8326_09060 [Tsuneonella sp. CC-YZS046]
MASDDNFHFAQMGDRWWMTETAWFSFCIPERKMGGWFYNMIRPNIGTVSGGAWVWDDSATLPWEVPYSSNLTVMPLQEDADLNDITLRNGVSLKTLEPLKVYRIGYEDGDLLKADLCFEAVMPPRPLRKPGSAFGDLTHFDQFGRVTGKLHLHGEEIAVDCLAMRDRSWGPRPEHRPRKSAYVTGIASPDDCFLFVTKANELSEQLAYGFMIKDGEIGDLVEGMRRVERDPRTGFVERILIEGVDEYGRRLEAEGKKLSGITLIRHSFIDHNGLMEWSINGKTGHGEDQDMWPVHDWSRYRRETGRAG